MEAFELAGGTVIGKDHIRTGKANQDAIYLENNENWSLGMVADGCGSSDHSEIGAQIGVRLVAKSIRRQMNRLLGKVSYNDQKFWNRVSSDVTADIRTQVLQMCQIDEDFEFLVGNFYLFTIVGVLIANQGAVFFSFGDGVILINGEKTALGPFLKNAPPYLAYQLLETVFSGSGLLNFRIWEKPLDQLDNFLIGTDGTEDLIAAADKNLSGRKETVGHISQFWTENKFFINPDMANRRLRLINTESMILDRQRVEIVKDFGKLPDDTTIVFGRKIRKEG